MTTEVQLHERRVFHYRQTLAKLKDLRFEGEHVVKDGSNRYRLFERKGTLAQVLIVEIGSVRSKRFWFQVFLGTGDNSRQSLDEYMEGTFRKLDAFAEEAHTLART